MDLLLNYKLMTGYLGNRQDILITSHIILRILKIIIRLIS